MWKATQPDIYCLYSAYMAGSTSYISSTRRVLLGMTSSIQHFDFDCEGLVEFIDTSLAASLAVSLKRRPKLV